MICKLCFGLIPKYLQHIETGLEFFSLYNFLLQRILSILVYFKLNFLQVKKEDSTIFSKLYDIVSGDSISAA
jgi:hypothetical protein